jgi:hypothetical protein
MHTMKAYRGSGCTAPPILKLNTRCEWLTSRPGRFSPENWALWIGREAGWTTQRVWTFQRRDKSLPLAGFQPRIIHLVRLITAQTELRRLRDISLNAPYM